jgi:hypothetical protein
MMDINELSSRIAMELQPPEMKHCVAIKLPGAALQEKYRVGT